MKYEKGFMCVREAAYYLNMSISTLYKLTASGKIHHYKPNGKKLFFIKEELDKWVMRGGRYD